VSTFLDRISHSLPLPVFGIAYGFWASFSSSLKCSTYSRVLVEGEADKVEDFRYTRGTLRAPARAEARQFCERSDAKAAFVDYRPGKSPYPKCRVRARSRFAPTTDGVGVAGNFAVPFDASSAYTLLASDPVLRPRRGVVRPSARSGAAIGEEWCMILRLLKSAERILSSEYGRYPTIMIRALRSRLGG